MRFPHRQVAELMGMPSPEAARARVAGALLKLAEAMERHVSH